MTTKKRSQSRLRVVAIAGSILVASAAQAVPIVFTLDPGLSSLDASGYRVDGPFEYPIEAQDAGLEGMTTTYSGTVTVDVDALLAPTTIEFLGASSTAANSGSWLPNDVLGSGPGENSFSSPGDPAPANYGVLEIWQVTGQVVMYGALRDLAFTVTSGPLVVSGGMFSSSQILETTSGRVDYHLVGLGGTIEPEDGESHVNTAADGTYAVAGNIATLTMPVIVYDPGLYDITLTGTLVGTAVIPDSADFDGDDDIDGLDFLAWQRGFGIASGATKAQGDADYNGTVDSADLAVWEDQLGGPPPLAAGIAATPEPGTLGLLIAALIPLHCGRSARWLVGRTPLRGTALR